MNTSKKKPIVFVGHSCKAADRSVISLLMKTISSSKIKIVSDEQPEAKGIGEKIRRRIDSSDVFIGIFTRRHLIRENNTWTTSPWIVEEKGYSLGQNSKRPIILIVEDGVPIPTEIGGLEGDLEYLVFDRTRMPETQKRLREILRSLSL